MKHWIIGKAALISAALLSFAAPQALAHPGPYYHDADDDEYEDEYEDWRDERREERRAYRTGYRDGYWDAQQHNGYYYNGQWSYGPPPRSYYDDPGYRPGYRAWRRGTRLPSYYYREHCDPVDWRAHRLSAPPRNHHWVRDDRGEYLLVGIATGLILGLAAAH